MKSSAKNLFKTRNLKSRNNRRRSERGWHQHCINPILVHYPECTAIDTVCQESLTSVYVAWSPFLDDETGISRYQIAVGTSAGGGQIKAFFDVPLDTRYYQVKGLNLHGERQVSSLNYPNRLNSNALVVLRIHL